LVAAARGRPIPAADEIPDEVDSRPPVNADTDPKLSLSNLNNLMVPISSRSQSFNSDTSSNISPSRSTFPVGADIQSPSSAATSIGSALSRGRAKTLASLTGSRSLQTEMTPREINLPNDPYVSGQPLEAYLYKDASECPICFLFYPPYLNKTRCCDQAICSECFVQIKRSDPHPPEHADPATPTPAPNAEEEAHTGELISEPAACPFCKQPEFGVTYEAPPFRRGLGYANHPFSHPLNRPSSAMSSSSSLGSALSNSGRLSPTTASRRRTTSVSATSPTVITTDRVRPDWATKLATARANTARRSAAATALHTAAYLMGTRDQPDGRSFGAFGRRGLLRRVSGADSPSAANGSTHLNMLALMSERYAAQVASRIDGNTFSEGTPSIDPGPRGSSRRGRMDDLEDMMMMEAIRLSLASEEERRKREEKDAKKDTKKEAKKKDKENKKAEKAARKTGFYPSSVNASSSGLSNSQNELAFGDSSINLGKGKANVQSGSEPPPVADPRTHLERARAQLEGPSPYFAAPYRPSQLRTLSNASSSASSIEGSVPSSLKDFREPGASVDASSHAIAVDVPQTGSSEPYISGMPPSGGAGTESMLNFRSLSAMIGEDERTGSTLHHEDTQAERRSVHHRDESPSLVDPETERGISGLHGANETDNPDPPSLKMEASS